MKIEITQKSENVKFTFEVINPDKLIRSEVEKICTEMNVKAIFVNGKIYNL